MARTVLAIRLVALTLAAFSFPALTLTSCASWEETKRDIVTPFNQLVHFDYPAAFKGRSVDDVAMCYAPSLREWGRRDAEQILRGFSRVDRARCVIHNAAAPDSDGCLRSECVLRVDGIREGKRRTWEQERIITAKSRGTLWQITKVEPGRTMEASPTTTFLDETAARGLIATNRSRGVTTRSGEKLPNLGSSGLALGDIDGDGHDDVLLISGDKLRLFRNRGGRFEDVTATSGIVTPPKGECRCGYFGDLDNDGDQDLFVGLLDGENLLFENLGEGRFREVPEKESGLQSLGHTAGACLGDFDSDGDLDLFVVSGNNMWVTAPDPPDDATNANPNQYYRNDGGMHFTEVTEAAGLVDTRWGLACATADYDHDGDLDLYVANDVGLDLLYRNRGDGTFDNVADDAGLVFHGSSMSAAFGDVNGDGWADLYVSGMASNSRWLMNQPGFPLPAPWLITTLFRGFVREAVWEMFHGNRLYLNQQDGTFQEVSTETRTYWVGWAASGVLLDFDNDTHTDLYTANGFWTGEKKHDC